MAAKIGSAPRKKTAKTKAPRRPVRGKDSEPSLSLERIVTVAVELLDADGIGGLSMRRLAESLGSGVMSLYWHVSNKEDVFDLALDSVLAYREPRLTGKSEDWRRDVIHILKNWRVAMLRHPWSVSLLPRRALGPNTLGRLELLSKTLSRAGVADADLNAAIWSLWNYVMGATITRANFELSAEDQAAAQQNLTDLGERYPTIARSHLLLDDDWEGAFQKGLDFLLDGIAPAKKR